LVKERSASFDEKIAQDQISIREVILQMEFQWPQPKLKPAWILPSQFNSGAGGYPIDILDPEKLTDILKNLTNSSGKNLVIVVDFPRWTHEEHLSANKLSGGVDELASILRSTGVAVKGSEEWGQYQQAEQKMQSAASDLKRRLTASN
jgi:hypothetical protein